MAVLGRVVGGFLALWIIFYITAYIMYMAPDDVEQRASENVNTAGQGRKTMDIADTPFAVHRDKEHRYIVHDVKSNEVGNVPLAANLPSVVTNPFVSATCAFLVQHGRETMKGSVLDGIKNMDGVGVIIPTRNENKWLVLKTVESILKNSGNELRKIIVVDDNSIESIASWSEWDDMKQDAETRFGDTKDVTNDKRKGVLEIVRSSHRLGVAGAKAYGASLLVDPVNVVVFVDAHVIVSHDWLIPLITALDKHPQAIVYPAIDVIDGTTGDMMQGDNAVGAFDWSLNFRWELMDTNDMTTAHSRIPLSTKDQQGHPSTENDLVASPASPGIFAMKLRYYNDIGGLNVMLYPWGQDSVELSIRTWLCGGMVVKQPCSRVAHVYNHLYEDGIVGNGVMQTQIDKNVLSVAEMWLSPEQREIVYQARFVDRVPYSVELSLDARQPYAFMHVEKLNHESCQSFDWFITEVYPGLQLDRSNVAIAYQNHLSSGYFEKSMKSLIQQYNKLTTITAEAAEVNAMKRRENQPEEIQLKNSKKQVVPKAVDMPQPPSEEELHDNKVRDYNLCEDRPVKPGHDYCKVMATPDNCERNRISLMFSCPKSCHLCGNDGKTCFDYYLKKCPDWKAEGKCSSDEANMRNICRVTCGFCTLDSQTPSEHEEPVKEEHSLTAKLHVNKVTPVKEVKEENGDAPAIVMEHNSPPIQPIINHNTPPEPIVSDTNGVVHAHVVHPYTAQEQYEKGLLPDPPSTPTSACALNDRPHGKLLAYMTLQPPAKKEDNPPRIFCGIYTMEKNHKTNVQATKETWAKRCTGFVAFSTVTDESIPSFYIEHEGEEAYDNMWQKSRSIWKYVYQHYADAFDFFLMGGDDMFYVIENLQHYLMSEEIVKLKESQNGLFLGRRFYPTGNVDEKVFNSGGAGYVLDQKALKALGPMLDDPKCFPHQKGFWEDVNVANCLRISNNIIPHDTRDAKQRERFHPFTPGQHLDYQIPKKNPDWYPKYNPWLKEGYDCCAPDSISFHYSPADITRQLYNYLYHCENKHNRHNS